ncbi:zinc-binding metallopeptidase [Chryseosolibacter indicus]|uniref:Zinc-binding metallopeptidase n=1 Tax=Chryseosolibacter indicus TaxID=2782351 RepID=A0ABS5VSL3_9BACT|nr:putative zinc-binding metallopeptidase [Chryseosolibacter indicus]MBT1703792.1 putative zinc-binding metallopeptidase [Chryseosolibacter indicus]
MRCTKYILSTLVLALMALACEDAYNDKVDPSKTDYLGNEEPQTTELDTWLLNSFTYPFNIEVKYRWDASEGDIYRTLVPPKVSQIKPVMETVNDVWITPYSEIAGGTFIKTYCPKQFLLVGSAHYNPDGTFTLGTAEGGRKVVLYVVNNFSPTERSALKTMMHIVHHEFGHILNQKVSYPSAFRDITAGLYTSDWRFNSVTQARANGFITNYAMASPDEDFVEMVATMLIEGREGYEAILECETNAPSLEMLRKKEQLVVQYYKEAFNIDFYGLQSKVQEAINELAPPQGGPEELPPLFDVWGYGKEKTSVRFDLSTLNQPAEFTGRFNQDNRVLHNNGLALDYNFKMSFTAEDELALRIYYYNLNDENRVYQQANFYYTLIQRDDGSIIISASFADENGYYLEGLKATALPSFFANRTFTIDWLQTCSDEVYVGFHLKDNPETFCYGMLEN